MKKKFLMAATALVALLLVASDSDARCHRGHRGRTSVQSCSGGGGQQHGRVLRPLRGRCR